MFRHPRLDQGSLALRHPRPDRGSPHFNLKPHRPQNADFMQNAISLNISGVCFRAEKSSKKVAIFCRKNLEVN